MDRSKEGEDLVSRFVSDLGALVQRGAHAELTAALGALEAAPPNRRPDEMQAATPDRRRRRAPVQRDATPHVREGDREPPASARGHGKDTELDAAAGSAGPEPAPTQVGRVSRRRRAVPVVGDGSAADPRIAGADDRQPVSDAGPAVALTHREARVLDVVRQLVRATVAETAERSGLPNGTVHVVLRSLLTKGRIAKTETARGTEYSLVSSGGIRPFKRVKTSSTPSVQASNLEDHAPSPSASLES